jgi:hypothetical protein
MARMKYILGNILPRITHEQVMKQIWAWSEHVSFAQHKAMKERMIVCRVCVDHPIGFVKGKIHEFERFHLNHSASISR